MSEGAPTDWKRPLIDLLEIEDLGDDRFAADLDGFGGVTLGCCVRAAATTCRDRFLHSLHLFFLRPILPGSEVEIRIERVRDGRRFAHRRMSAVAAGRLLCEGVASFTVAGEGLDYTEPQQDGATPQPEDLPTEEDIARAEGWDLEQPGPLGGPLEWRWIGSTPWNNAAPGTHSRYRSWVRPRAPLSAEPALHSAALAYLTDYHSHLPVARRLGGNFDPIGITSLDQTLWVHRDLPWDDWWLLDSESDVAHGGRAFSRRRLFARDGQLIATMAQESLVPAEPMSG